ncbi:hypothetical protein ACTHGU_02180 [Chitinophagaceae bacterium MMS25-I14]
MHILIFKTTVEDTHDQAKVRAFMDRIAGNGKWTIDLGDEDKVLRVEHPSDISPAIMSYFNEKGFFCAPLAICEQLQEMV